MNDVPVLPARGVALCDRPVLTGTAPLAPPALSGRTPGGDGRRRHCHVQHPDGPLQGLVLQWAQEPAGWAALTIYVIPRPGGDLIVQEWLPAHRLTPV